MKLHAALMAFFFAAGPAAAQQAVCANGQPCPNGEPLPFPVINPAKGLNDILTYPLRHNQPPPPAPILGYAPVATPPPVLPPSR
ncbi:MAG TPA: hypothetical protein VJS47_04990 [Rhizomicrobium sp.]|nr:hypothetical protein [Rhizomicrobium sp.]